MKIVKKYFAGLVFLVIAIPLITIMKINPLLVTTQDVGSQAVYTITGIPNGSVAIQQITLKKDYINGIGILLTINGRLNTNDNVILVLNSDYKVLWRETFSSKNVKDFQYYPLNFNKSIKIGQGKSLYLCFYSYNGEENNHVSVCCKPYSTLGKLFVSEIHDNDVLGAVQKKTKSYPGSFIVKTYESIYDTSFILKLIFYLLAAGLALLIIYSRLFFIFIGRFHLQPEFIFVIFSAVVGTILVFLTPPMQVPDEQIHFTRAYQVSELNIFKTNQTLPRSILHLDTIYQRMKFNSSEKTSWQELSTMTKMQLEQQIRQDKGTNDYFAPYIPAALGIFFGRLFQCSPVILLFLGRIFNLFFTIFMIYLAIRITPVHKWIFFLLGLMPMTLFLLASLSYDSMAIGLSFLLLSLFFRYICDENRRISSKDVAILVTLIFLLALCKAPYYMLGALFLLIPVKKTGAWKKHLLVFALIIVTMFIGTHLWVFCRTYFSPNVPLLSEQAYGLPKWMTPDNPGAQFKFILTNIKQYIGILLNTTFRYKGYSYVEGFVGNLGWEDTPFPFFFILSYLIMLVIAALGDSTPHANPGWIRKIIFFFFFLTGYVLIETGFYIATTPLKAISVEGVQGRYFIPFAALFFIVFYNNKINVKLNLAFSLRKGGVVKGKIKERSKVVIEMQKDEQFFTKFLHFVVISFTVLSLLFTIYILAHRYYYIGETLASVDTRKNAERTEQMKVMKNQENQQVETRYINLANAAAQVNKLDSVTIYLEKVLQIDPSHAQAAHNLAIVYLQLKQKDKAVTVIERMKANGLEIPQDLLNLAK